MIVTAPFFWILVGFYELVIVVTEGMQYWSDLMFDPDDEDEEETAKEK